MRPAATRNTTISERGTRPVRLIAAALMLSAALLALGACATSAGSPAAGHARGGGARVSQTDGHDRNGGARKDAGSAPDAAARPGPENPENASSRFDAGGGDAGGGGGEAGRPEASSRFEEVGAGDRSPGSGAGEEEGDTTFADAGEAEDDLSDAELAHAVSQRLPSVASDPDAEDLGAREKERLSLITSGFVSSAYGYSGDGPDAYLGGVMEVSVATGLFDSPGGERIKRYAEMVRDHGLRSAAELRALDVSRARRVDGFHQVDVVAYFLTGERYAPDGSVEAPTAAYRQRLILSPYADIFKVAYAGPIRPVQRVPDQRDFRDGGGA